MSERLAMFALLVKTRLLGLWNVARYSASRNGLLSAGLSLLGIVLFTAVYVGFRLFLGLSRSLRTIDELVYEIFHFLFLFLLAGAVPFVASTLLHSGDYPLLLATPIRPQAIIAAKLLDATVTNSLQFTVIGLPAIAACATALEIPAAWYPMVVLLILLFVLLPAIATALVLLSALAVFGRRRVRGAIATVNLVMAAIVCLTIVVQVNRLPLRHSLAFIPQAQTLRDLPALTPAPSSEAHTSPSAWFADALIAISHGDITRAATLLALLTIVIAGLYGLCLVLGAPLLLSTSLEDEEENRPIVSAGPIRARRNGILYLLSSPVAAVLAKDLRYLMRDSILLGQLGMPIILFFVPYALAMQESLRSVAGPSELYIVSIGMTGFIVFMQTSILSLSSIGLESRGFWMLLASPNGGRTLLWSKFAMSTLVSGGIGAFLMAFNGLMFRAGAITTVLQCIFIVLIAAALCGMGVGISAALPRFVYENPAHRVSAWALILGFFATAFYLFVAASVFVVAYLAATQLPEYASVIYASAVAIFLLVSVISVLFPMWIGSRRIETYQWVH